MSWRSHTTPQRWRITTASCVPHSGCEYLPSEVVPHGSDGANHPVHDSFHRFEQTEWSPSGSLDAERMNRHVDRLVAIGCQPTAVGKAFHMARVVCVHGIGAQVSGDDLMLNEWLPAMNVGLKLARCPPLTQAEVAVASYGHVYRPAGRYHLSVEEPYFQPSDVDPGLERELLVAWWEAAALVDPAIERPEADSLAGTPASVQAILFQLSKSSFFAGLAMRAVIRDLKQVRRYLFEPELREEIRGLVRALITDETQVVVAHSLGSVVAYEALCSMPKHPVRTFVTLGSPLGIPNLIFERLEPAPTGGIGAWPGRTELKWINIADSGDPVALVKKLNGKFGGKFAHRIWDAQVHNSVHAHSAASYLTDKLTGEAIARGLDGR